MRFIKDISLLSENYRKIIFWVSMVFVGMFVFLFWCRKISTLHIYSSLVAELKNIQLPSFKGMNSIYEEYRIEKDNWESLEKKIEDNVN